MAVSLRTPICNINSVPEIMNTYVQWLSQYNILEIYNYIPSGYLNTAEIEKHIHILSGHINTVPIYLTYILSDNLNTCAISRYTNTLNDDNQTEAIW